MGLLQKLEAQKALPQKRAKGLIKRAESYAFVKPKIEKNTFSQKQKTYTPLLIDESHVYFSEFSQNHAFVFSGILRLDKKNYSLAYSYKLQNNATFNSTKDFWDGTLLHSDTWNIFKEKDLSAFYQFFTDELHDTMLIGIKHYTINQNSYIFFFAIDKKHQTYCQILKNDQKLHDFICIIDELFLQYTHLSNENSIPEIQKIQDALAQKRQAYCISLINKSLAKNQLISEYGITAIYEAIAKVSRQLIPPPGFCVLQKHTIKLLLFSNETFDAELFLSLFTEYLSDYLHYATLIGFEIDMFIKTKELQAIEDFLGSSN